MRRATGLRLADFAELTGSMRQPERARLWAVARMLFLTPQTLLSDIAAGICPAETVVCVVVDEAHKATGNHAYVQVVRQLTKLSGGFRVLALSATPGGTLERIQEVRNQPAHLATRGSNPCLLPALAPQVVTNLRISRLEARDETSVDVVGCLNERAHEVLVLPLTHAVAEARDAVGKVSGANPNPNPNPNPNRNPNRHRNRNPNPNYAHRPLLRLLPWLPELRPK